MTSTIVLLAVTILGLASMVECGVLFTSLNRTLVVTAQVQSSKPSMAQAGEDHIVVAWSLNSSFVGVDSNYDAVNIKLCFAPISQVGRGWRKTKPDLSLDKTCSAAKIATMKYTAAGNTTNYRISKEVPPAHYFVRAYAVDARGSQLAFGQSTNKNKTTNIVAVEGISGKKTSIDIAAGLFSAFAVLTLFSFLGWESLVARRRASKA